MDFPKETLLPQKTIFRKGASSEIAAEALELGPRGLVVHGKSLEKDGKKEKILEGFPREAVAGSYCRAAGEPTLDEISAVIDKAREIEAGWIVGAGGGSVLDLAKAAAGLYNAKEKPLYYQEGGGLEKKGIPFIAVPTTAGTGSEATPNSVIINKEKKTKLSIRDKSFMARKVVLDVDLLKGMPPSVLSHSAMDALVQGYESYISKNATWFSENFALKGIRLINSNILPAHETGAEENLAPLLLGSFLVGIALASSRLGVIHGIAHPLGAIQDLPHGLICSILFMPSIEVNKDAMGKKYEVLSGTVGADLTMRVEALLKALNITSPLKGKDITGKEKIIECALASGSTAANPKPIEREDVEFMLKEIFR